MQDLHGRYAKISVVFRDRHVYISVKSLNGDTHV
jgi:hypothetical protein